MSPGFAQVREGEAPAGLAAVYVDVRHVLRLSYVPLLFRAVAAHDQALRTLWPRLRPLFAMRAFEEAADDLRAHVARAAHDLGTPLIETELAAAGFDVDDDDDVRQQVDVFHYADAKLMLCATVMLRALHGQRVGGAHVRPALRTPLPEGVPPDMADVARLPEQPEAIHAEVLGEILAATHLPATVADLNSLGRWPGFLETAWRELGPVFRSPRLEPAVREAREEAGRLCDELPNVVELPPGTLPDPVLAPVRRVVEVMADALPRLAFFAAALKVAMDGVEDSFDSPFPIDWDSPDAEALEEEADAPGP